MEGFQSHFVRNKATYILVAILAAVLCVWGIWYLVSLRIAGTGTIEIKDVVAGTRVTVDGKTVEEVSSGMSTIHTDVRPGQHTVNATSPGFWPWTKTVTVPRDTVIHIAPFLLPEYPRTRTAESGTDELTQARMAFGIVERLETPGVVNSNDGTTSAWVENNVLYAQWNKATSSVPDYFCVPGCTPILPVLSAGQPITTLSFLGSRNDVLIFTVPDGIFALELDTRGTQNFQPVYQENDADFRVRDDASLYIRSGDDYLILEI